MNKTITSSRLVFALLMLASGLAGSGLTYLALTQKWFEPPPPPPVVMSDKPLFKPLEKIVVGVGAGRSQRYMMLEMSLVSHDPRIEEQSGELKPVIYNAVLKYFSQHSYEKAREEIRDIESLQTSLLAKVVETAQGYGYPLPIEKLLLTKVVIQ